MQPNSLDFAVRCDEHWQVRKPLLSVVEKFSMESIYLFINYWLLGYHVLTKISEDHTASLSRQKNKPCRTGRKMSLWNIDNCHQGTKRHVLKDSNMKFYLLTYFCVYVHIYSLFSNAVSRMISKDLKFTSCEAWKEKFFDLFRAFSLQFPGDAEDNHELFESIQCPGKDSILVPS